MTFHQTDLRASSCSIYLHVIFLFFVTVLCLQPTIIATASTNETDRLALLKFKESVPHDPYNILSSWNDSMHFCKWHGITCGHRHKRVTVLDLHGCKLRGSLSPYIGNLSFLRSIILKNNSFYGEIPQEVGHLFRLQQLILNNNTLEGEIPFSLSNCSSLRFINLSVNKLKGKIPSELGSLMNLEEIGLAINNLIGSIPPSLGNLSSLIYFYVGDNNLVGNIPDVFGQLKGLVLFSISGNKLLGVIPTSFGRFLKMQALNLNGNRLSGEIPTFIGNLTQLFALGLKQNRFEGAIPPSIVNCQNLQLLDISQNNLDGSIPPQLIGPSSPPLTSLDLSHNLFTGKLPFEVDSLKNIFTLDVSYNNLSGEIPTSIGNCLMLEFLNLERNSFEGAIPSSMASLQGLQFLDVSQNNLSGSIPKGLEKLSRLENLNISFNNFEGEVPEGGVFKNTSVISLIGNTKLCGGVPKLQLPKCPIKVMKPRNSIGFKLAIGISSIVLFLFLFSSFLVLYRMKKSKKKSPSVVSTMDLIPNVSYKELYQATNGFSLNNLIGSGSFGSVYKGTLDQEERLVAIKVFNLQQKGVSKSFMAECNALRNIRHRNLVKILTCCSSMDYNGNQFKALVFEFMIYGSLDVWLHLGVANENQSRNLSLLQRLNIAIDVAFAIDYLHNHSVQPIIHCDLKPSNVLLDNDMVAHVSDFGLARLLPITDDSSRTQASTSGIKGSIGYIAPEYGMGGEASIEGDVYSYGILLLEMFIGKRPSDDMFKDGHNLHNFVEMALPEKLVQIVDPILLPREVDEAPIAIVAAREDNNGNEMQVDEEAQGIANLCQMDLNEHKCLVSILEIGLACSMESPKDRMKMKEVTKELHLIKNVFLGSGINRDGFRRIQV
ncbi:hypothetical protein RGQ29_029228 [Quercus rubra]|uniref:non-specific serine/threonine protein kinase n=1 Tax=Quercus rubra TaxID=3512 RepID=A0AAN7EUA8_QUERU|nr:hypothetical protein RGQ29_029228 [Quercus rubra]